MDSSRVFARNLMINWGGFVVNALVMFLLSPFVVHSLGKVEYGIWSLINVITGYMGVLDLGIKASTGRFVVLYFGKDDHDSVDTTIRTGLGFYSCLGGLLIVTGAGLGWVFPSAFTSVPEEYHSLVRIILLMMAANLWISAFRAISSHVLSAHERFDIIQTVDMLALGLRAIGTLVALMMGYGIIGLTVVVMGSNFLNMFLMLRYTRKIYSRFRIWPLMLSRKRLNEMISYGVASFISAVSVKIAGQTDLVLVGFAINVASVAVYSVGASPLYYTNILTQIDRTFFPAIQKAVACGKMGDARWLVLRQAKISLFVGLPFYVGLMMFSYPFIHLWMYGPKFDQGSVAAAALVMTILAGARLPLLLEGPMVAILNSLGRVKLKATVVIIEALANLGLSLLFVMALGWGLMGVALGTLVSRIFVRTFPLTAYGFYHAKFSLRTLIVKLLLPGVAVGVLFAAWVLAVQRVFSQDSWGMFFFGVGLSVAGYIPIAWWILLSLEDRAMMMSSIKTRIFGNNVVSKLPGNR